MLTGTSVIMYAFTRSVAARLGYRPRESAVAAFAAGTMVLILPVYAVLSVYMSTDPALIFFWSLTLFLLFRAFMDGKMYLWAAAGIAMGFAMHCKFLAFFLPLGALLFCLISRTDRKWLMRPHPYVAGLCSLAVLAPFLWWNANHNWATFMFNLVYRQKTDPFTLEHVPTYIGAQMLALSPGIFLYLVYALIKSLRKWSVFSSRIWLYLGCSTLAALLYFSLTSFKAQIDPHWLAPAWLGTVAALAILWGRGGRLASLFHGKLRAGAIVLCVIITLGIYAVLHVPPRWLDFQWKYAGDPGRINVGVQAERFGWHKLGERVAEIRSEMLAAQEKGRGVFIICDEYGFTADVAFYTPGQPATHLWSERRRHGENYRYWDDYEELTGQDAIFVTKELDEMEDELPVLQRHFSRTAEPEALPIVVDGMEVRRFYLLRCYSFDGSSPYATGDRPR
jgi:dolichol-phosphate mannosyltransferase